MIFKMKLAFWYLRHPEYYPEFRRRIKRAINSIGVDKNKEKIQATKWCEENSIDTKTALQRIIGSADFDSFHDKFREQLSSSRSTLEKSSVISGPGNLELIYQLAEHIKATKVIETGVAYGWSSLAFLLSLKNRKDSILLSTNIPYSFKGSENFVGCVVPEDLRSNWKIFSLPDREGLPKALNSLDAIDMCHYDSDKSYEGRSWAYPKLWEALRKGGVFISDDIDDNFAFRDFCRSIDRGPIIVKALATVGFKYVGVLLK